MKYNRTDIQYTKGKRTADSIKKIIKRGIAALCASAILFTSEIPAQAKDASTALRIGIDVSRYQGNIDWNTVSASGIRYSFVRVGSTRYGVDSMFDRNMRAANAAGVQTGVYIYSYAQNATEAAAEAMFVLSAIANYTVSMPVVIDIEDSCQASLPPQTLSEIANTFCAVIESAGYYPMVYASKYWFTNKIGPVAYDKWVAQYNTACAIEDAAFWQATASGAVAGVGGAVDIDYQYKDLSTSIIPYGFLYRKGFYYFYENYKMKTNSFVSYNGGMYYVDGFGRRISGFMPLGGNIYYFNQDGLMLTGWQNLGGNTYYFGSDGKMAVGLTKIGDQTFMFDGNGCLYRGWLSTDHLYYFYEDGHMAVGFSAIGSDFYFFDTNGYVQIGWQTIDGGRYYFNPMGGKLMYGWINDGTGMYYTDSTGKMQTGLVSVDGAMYNMGTDGKMLFGWQKLNGADYYFDPASGKMLTGWNLIGADMYYFEPASGIKQTGWLAIGSDLYYLDADGRRVTGLRTIDGVNYFFSVEGKRQTGFVAVGTQMYYFDPSTAAQVKGWCAVGGNMYYMDEKTGNVTIGAADIGGEEFYFDETGRMQTGFITYGNGIYFYNPAGGAKMYGLVTDGVYNYYMDPTDGHMILNSAITLGDSILVADENGHITVAQ